MKKLLKGLLYAFLGLVLILVIGAAYIHFRGIPTYTPEKIKLKVEITPEKIDLGRKIASVQCIACHFSNETEKLTGTFRQDVPPIFGKVISANITNDKEFGIGSWTDGDLVYFLRTGVKPNGNYAPPYMPKYPLMATEDLEAVIAFLRSDAEVVQASQEKTVPCEPSFLAKLLCNFVFLPGEFPKEKIEKPKISDEIAYGEYLVTAQLDCYACHSADFTTNDILNPKKSKGYLGGGNMLLDLKGKPVYSANITMDEETGIGKWTEEQFIKAMKSGKLPNGKQLRYPMTPFPVLDNAEVKAIYAYLKTVPKINNKVNRQ